MKRIALALAVCVIAAIVLGYPPAAAAQVYQVVHAFTAPPGAPMAGMIQATDGNFYGTTSGGGGASAGTVFEMNSSGSVTVLHAFLTDDGAQPNAALLQASDGDFYGTTSLGGQNGDGTVFKITAAGALTTLHHFNGTDGANPYGALVEGTDGNFYGTTEFGGAGFSNLGTVFQMTPAGTVTTLYSFAGGDGALPVGGLVQGDDGKFYGTTSTGGLGVGSVFQIDTASHFNTLHKFAADGSEGVQPSAPLIQATDGKFYGTTYGGGTSANGTVFRIDTLGTFASLRSFSGTDGSACSAGLIQAADGKFYGATKAGGPTGHGNVFRIDTAGTLTSLYPFSGGGDGSEPAGNLVQGTDANFYGTTSAGGANGVGTTFRMTSAGAITTLHTFGGASGGQEPEAAVIRTSDGTLYGTTNRGGTANDGTVFKVDSGATATVLHNFAGMAASDGATPQAELVQASNGKFYGTTATGGAHDLGSVFQIDSAGTLTTLHSFNDTDGDDPVAGLIQGTDGLLYGTTQYGGDHNLGTIFKISMSGTFTPVHSFAGSEGAYPAGTLLQAADGNFYGTTWAGGDNNSQGNVYKMTAAGVVTSLYSFTGGDDGNFPYGALIQSGGNLYGTTRSAGAGGGGTVFRMTTGGSITTLHGFNGSDGAGSLAGIILASDGNFYGTTYSGGSPNKGTIFKMTSGGTVSTVHAFTGADGEGAASGLIQGSDGALYGTTNQGGSGAAGVVYKVTLCSPPPAPTAGNNGPICAGQTLHLTASTVPGAAYAWAGPNGFTSTLQNPSIAAATAAASGTYTVTATVAGCVSPPATTTATVTALPSAAITAPTSICPGSTGVTASVPDAGPGATYAWTINNGTITGGAGTRTITISVSTATPVGLGVTVTSSHGCAATGSASIPVGGSCHESFYTLTPCRVIDTRGPTGSLGGPALSGGAIRTFAVASQCAIPATAKALSVNVTVTQSTGPGDLRLFPGGASLPLVSTINYGTGQTRANNAVVSLGATTNLSVRCDEPGGTVQFILDVNGYFQ